MELTTFMFQAPAPTYTAASVANELVFVAKAKQVSGKSDFTTPHAAENGLKHIPCLRI